MPMTGKSQYPTKSMTRNTFEATVFCGRPAKDVLAANTCNPYMISASLRRQAQDGIHLVDVRGHHKRDAAALDNKRASSFAAAILRE